MKSVDDNFVSYETAKLLKENGFPQDPYEDLVDVDSYKIYISKDFKIYSNGEYYYPCTYKGQENYYYDGAVISGCENVIDGWYLRVPLSVAQNWLRSIGYDIIVYRERERIFDNQFEKVYTYDIINDKQYSFKENNVSYGDFVKYEDALEAGIKFTLEYLMI